MDKVIRILAGAVAGGFAGYAAWYIFKREKEHSEEEVVLSYTDVISEPPSEEKIELDEQEKKEYMDALKSYSPPAEPEEDTGWRVVPEEDWNDIDSDVTSCVFYAGDEILVDDAMQPLDGEAFEAVSRYFDEHRSERRAYFVWGDDKLDVTVTNEDFAEAYNQLVDAEYHEVE